jgi:hypothetical protein
VGTLLSQQLSLLDHRTAEREDQENIEENEAIKENEDDTAPISDIDEIDLWSTCFLRAECQRGLEGPISGAALPTLNGTTLIFSRLMLA